MKNLLIILALLIFSNNTTFAQKYKTLKGTSSFFSKTPVEDINAVTNHVLCLIDSVKNTCAFQMDIRSFKFDNSLMEEHFNENYLESKIYPKGTFSGKINEKIDYTKPGTYNVTVTGELEIHGVKHKRTISGTIQVINSSQIKIASTFKVKLADHKIQVPKLVITKIAEVIDVKIEATLIK